MTDEVRVNAMLTEASSLMAQSISRISHGEPACAAWRIADAGLLLRRALVELDVSLTYGLDKPTGRGALLPEVNVFVVGRSTP
jgi:hypothetical protein